MGYEENDSEDLAWSSFIMMNVNVSKEQDGANNERIKNNYCWQ